MVMAESGSTDPSKRDYEVVVALLPVSGYQPHRLSVRRYDQMVEAGIFGSKEPIFLWKGCLVEKIRRGHAHCNTQATLLSLLLRIVPDGWFSSQGRPIAIGDHSEPEPDHCVVRGRIDDYEDRHCSTHEVALIIEVAESSSLAIDLGEALEMYAQGGIPCYWVVNLPEQRIEAFRKPEGTHYTEHRAYSPGEAIPIILDGREVGRIAVADVLF